MKLKLRQTSQLCFVVGIVSLSLIRSISTSVLEAFLSPSSKCLLNIHGIVQILILIFKNMDSVLYNFGSHKAPSTVPRTEQNHRFIDDQSQKEPQEIETQREEVMGLCYIRSWHAALGAGFQTRTFTLLSALLQPACHISVVGKISQLLII